MTDVAPTPRASSTKRLEPLRHVDAGVLNSAYYEAGPAGGPAVMLLHGFPYDIHSFVDVAPILVGQGCRVIVPYLRGYGPTLFRDKATPRSGEQAAVGADLMALMDALGIERAVFAGYDCGGRAASVIYTHLALPTKLARENCVVARSLAQEHVMMVRL